MMTMTITKQTLDVLLEKYEIAPPTEDTRFLSHALVGTGTALDVNAYVDEALGRTIQVGRDGEWVQHMCPLSDDAAMSMVRYLRDRHLIGPEDRIGRTLMHLLMRTARLFSEEELDSLKFSPVYLNHEGYRIGDASATSSKAIHAKSRLDESAHDKGAVFTARPTGRRTGARK